MFKMFKTNLMLAAAMAGLVSTLGGCSLFEETQRGPLTAAALHTIADVPVPYGFRYTDQGSWSKVDMEKKSRAAVQMYWGKAALLRVGEFYQEQLPKNKWSSPAVKQQTNNLTITASKPGETVSIRTWDDTFYTYIEISLTPDEAPVPATRAR